MPESHPPVPALAGYAAAIWLVLHLLVFFYEEPAMAKRFGAAYDTYRANVPRWIPRLRK